MLWLLALLPLLPIIKLLADARGRRLLEKAVGPKLRGTWISPHSVWREWTVLGLELGCLALFIVAMARPLFGFTEEEVLSSGRSIMLAVDTSRSMLAEDIKPNRLERTKLVAAELIRKLPGDKIGLIAFAGRAFVQAPVTQDHGALFEALEQFDTDIIPRGGSNLGEAIDLAVEAFTGYLPDGSLNEKFSTNPPPIRQSAQALLIFSDGEELEGSAIEAAKRAEQRGVMIISVGVGTAEGTVIPVQETGRGIFGQQTQGAPDYQRDESGKIVKSQLIEKNLVAVANETRGLYIPLLNLIKDERLPQIMKKLEVGDTTSKTLKRAIERYQIPLALGCLLLVAGVGVRTLPFLKKA
jgi:Ca-activated chloride channel homolog